MKLSEYFKAENIDRYQAPSSSQESRIPFDLMDPSMFELLCCDLIEHMLSRSVGKDIEFITPIAGKGCSQYGADIFVKENVGGNNFYSLYEVKRVSKYDYSHYRKAVQRFIDNYEKWGLRIEYFYLCVAEDLSAKEIIEWQKSASTLSDLNVEYKIIPKQKLNEWIQSAPQLVYKYFHKAWVAMLWGEECVRSIEKYGIYSFEESANWVGYSGVIHTVHEDTFIYKNEHVFISGYLPSLKNNSLSCIVEFRNGKFSHVMTTLGGKQLIKDYFIGADFPLDEVGVDHPFLIKNSISERGGYFCDIGNTRIKISTDEAQCLIDAIRIFKYEYVKKVSEIEKEWRSHNFSCSSNTGEDIPLIQVTRGLWRLLLDFAYHNDAFRSDGEWSIFDSCPGFLKIYTSSHRKEMNVGYHCFIKPKIVDCSYKNLSNSDNEVILTWMPPKDNIITNNGLIGPRYYWDARTTHEWLITKLIPIALNWSKNAKQKRFSFKTGLLFFNKRCKEEYIPEKYLTSFYRESTSDIVGNIKTSNDLLLVIDRLQIFFHRSRLIYIDVESYKRLYCNLAEVLNYTNLSTDDFRYIYSNLNYLEANDFQSLILALKNHGHKSEKGSGNSFRIDCVLRSYQSCLKDGISQLNEFELNKIAEQLKPLIIFMEERELLERQYRYF